MSVVKESEGFRTTHGLSSACRRVRAVTKQSKLLAAERTHKLQTHLDVDARAAAKELSDML
eukprot:1264454-Pyramimonas_sp.AAC.1